jgi:DNA-binding transcriptional LysR family regulator
VFAEEARKVLTAFDLAVAEARSAAGVTTLVRIACSPFIPIEQLRGLLAALRERDSGVRTRVSHLTSGEQRQRLLRGDLDVGIFHLADNLVGLGSEPLFAGDRLVAYLRPGHPLESREHIRPVDVVDEVLVTYPRSEGPALHDRFYDSVAEAGYHFASRREASGPTERDLLLEVEEGHGVLLGPHALKEMAPAARDLIRRPLDPPVWLPDPKIVWRVPTPPHLSPVLSTLRTVAADLRAG